MSEEDIKAAIKETARQIAALEAQHPQQEMRPWFCNDNPIALEHWGFVQRRLKLKKELGRPAFTVEQRQVRASRMRENHATRRISYTQSAVGSASGPELPKLPNVDLSIGIHRTHPAFGVGATSSVG